jgi:hypothetical protein
MRSFRFPERLPQQFDMVGESPDALAFSTIDREKIGSPGYFRPSIFNHRFSGFWPSEFRLSQRAVALVFAIIL